MNIKNQINLLRHRLCRLSVNSRNNEGVRRKISRKIRNLEKRL